MRPSSSRLRCCTLGTWFAVILHIISHAPKRVSNRIAKGWPAEATCSRASFVREGVLMMCPKSLVTFLVRSLLLLVYYFLLQLPKRYQVRLDPDLFLRSITMEIDGKRVNTGPWEFAPGHRLPEDQRESWIHTVSCSDDEMVDQDHVRSRAWERWDAWCAVVATHIPSIGSRGPLAHHIPKPPSAGNTGVQSSSSPFFFCTNDMFRVAPRRL